MAIPAPGDVTGPTPKNPAAVALGKLGGRKGDPPGLRNCRPRVEGRSPEEQLSSAGEKSLTTSAFTETAKDPLPKVIR
jgi:hypothetical protein